MSPAPGDHCALLDSGATNNIFRASCLPVLPSDITIREGRGEVVVKLADGKPRHIARRKITLPYTFDGFRSNDDFFVIEMNYAFDCILGIPWLSRYQPEIDWLVRSVKRHSDFDVREVFTHVLVAQGDWPHVTVLDRSSTTHVVRRVSDGPLCTACTVLLHDDSSRRREGDDETAVEHGLPLINEMAVEHEFPPNNETAIEQGLPRNNETAGLSHVTDPVEDGLLRIERGEASPSESFSTSSSESSRWKKNKSKRRRLKPQREPTPSASLEVNTVSDDDLTSRPSSTKPKSDRERFEAQFWEALRESGNPVYDTSHEYADVFPDKIPAKLPADRGIRHEIDPAPGSKYCVTRQWPLPRDQVNAVDNFFESRRKPGHVRESISPHSSPTFCVKKATGGWRIVYAVNKLNGATIPAQTPIPRNDMVLDTMSGSVIYSAKD
ncbi:hypothetical protein PC129_g13424 [Phytophthora cactorum]|uniref:Polyprotein n=1 Tax=Phytophthora cactorum TaxID=29920 RepID=A0A8T1BNJ6_9STRA|nr:hypothetical protein PC112_g15146 [Phytophthora cactorum]KAG2814073.1 hypothetical protein PC111_g14127 [Phytophthora cactorum]KAG2892320.1 hypothetical protein PC114_g16673 [Phytophthora cactorum]KAG2905594.1 hypothetical protein PC115_g14553 [Phytophthora cactorum]KAG2973944.1 hypothetical protein PC118_g14821 [Phytophthora cactorum]